MIISEKILKLRKNAGLTQEEFAEQLDVSRQSVSKWEGAQSIPDIQKIMAMAKLFGVSTDYLLYDEIEDAVTEPTVEKSEKKIVTIEIANEFIKSSKAFAKMLSISLILFITSPLSLVISNYINGENADTTWGLIWLFPAVAIGVSIIIYYGVYKLSNYKYIETGDFELSFNVDGLVKKQKDDFSKTRAKSMIISVSMYIMAVLPMAILDGGTYEVYALAFLIIVVALATFIIVRSEYTVYAFNQLLKETDDVESPQAKKRSDLIAGVYWAVAVAVFLLWSFLFDDWGRSWIVWPVAGVLFVAVDAVLEYMGKTEK